MKHPYEAGGIMFTIAVLGGILGGVAFDNYDDSFPHDWKEVIDNGVHDMSGDEKDWSKYIPKLPKPVYNYYSCPDAVVDPEGQMECIRIGEVQECKMNSKNLQEFYDCVNSP